MTRGLTKDIPARKIFCRYNPHWLSFHGGGITGLLSRDANYVLFLQNIDLFFWLFGCVLKASVCSCIVLDIYLSFWYPSLIPCNNQYGDEVRDKSSFSPLLKVGLRVVLITLIFGDHYRALIGLIFVDTQREGPIRSLLSVCMSVCMPRKQTVNFVQIGAYDFFKLCTMKENINTYQMVKNPISIDLLVPLFGGP